MLTSRVLNLLALAFTGGCSGCCAPRCIAGSSVLCIPAPASAPPIALRSDVQPDTATTNMTPSAAAGAMSALLLLYVDWGALRAECLQRDTCDIWEVSGTGGRYMQHTCFFVAHPVSCPGCGSWFWLAELPCPLGRLGSRSKVSKQSYGLQFCGLKLEKHRRVPSCRRLCSHPCPPRQAAIRKHPLAGGLTAWTGLACAYLLLLSAYWLVALASLPPKKQQPQCRCRSWPHACAC
jgi:hypothetical protein